MEVEVEVEHHSGRLESEPDVPHISHLLLLLAAEQRRLLVEKETALFLESSLGLQHTEYRFKTY